jgi:hypothetical protein
MTFSRTRKTLKFSLQQADLHLLEGGVAFFLPR